MKKVLLLLVLLVLITGCEVKEVKKLTDAEKFSNDFSVSDKNPFVYSDYKQIKEILNTSGIIFLATPDNEGSIKAAGIINDVAKENKVDKIHYYNPYKIKNKKDTKKLYDDLVKYFKDYIKVEEKDKDKEQATDNNKDSDDNNKESKVVYNLNIPILASIKDGKIVGYSNYFSIENQLSEEELTKKKTKQIKEEYKKILNYQICSNCN